MSTSGLRAYVEARERELRQRKAVLCDEVDAIDSELAEIEKVKAALSIEATRCDEADEICPPTTIQSEQKSGAEAVYDTISGISKIRRTFVEAAEKFQFIQFEHMTLKELAVSALKSKHFPLGATTAELCEFLRNAYGRDVPPSSLSPQLSRLKANGVVRQEGDRWQIVPPQGLDSLLEIEPSNGN